MPSRFAAGSAVSAAPPAPVWREAAGFACLLAALLAAYSSALHGGFLWDDAGHVTRPDLRSWHGLGRIWFELGATQQYYPLLHSAFWAEHRLWGDSSLGYHLANVVFHATGAWLFVLILRRLTSARWALVGGFLFALHPICVESVAWISEQKNTLSAVWYFAAALAYLRFEEKRPAPGLYLLSTLFFALALLTKSVTATLPGTLLVAVWWKRGRLHWKRDVAPLIPWFVLGAASGLFTAWVERTKIGAEGAPFDLSVSERLLLAARIPWFYLGKLLWPSNLTFIYPHWNVNVTAEACLFAAAFAAVAVVCWGLRARHRAPWAVLLCFVGALFPVLGFFNVYPFVFSYVADHFQYLAVPVAVAAAAPALKTGLGAAALGMLAVVFGILTWRQAATYRDAETLYRTTLARNPACWMAQYNLGATVLQQGRIAEARDDFESAVRLKPDYIEARNNLGALLARNGRYAEAVDQFEAALRYRPDNARLHYNLANALADAGRTPDAIAQYRRALELRSDYPAARYHLSLALLGREEPAAPRP